MALSGPNASSYLANNLLALPYTVQVSGTSGQAAYTTYGYDESALQTPNPPVTEQKVTGESYPGNQTSVHRWLNGSTVSHTCSVSVSNGYLVSNNVFFNTGEVQQSTDPCGNATTYLYSSTYFGAYPTTVTNALGQSTTYAYDLNSGSVTSIQDPNTNALPTTKSYDIMDRLLSVNYPDGGSTSYCYTDGVTTACPSGNAGNAPFAVVDTKAITSSTNEISTATVDGLGRLSQTQLGREGEGGGGGGRVGGEGGGREGGGREEGRGTPIPAEQLTHSRHMTRSGGHRRCTTPPAALRLRVAAAKPLGERRPTPCTMRSIEF